MLPEVIIYHQESPTGDLFVLNASRQLIKYIRKENEYMRDIWVDLNNKVTTNFTFDINGHILAPTGTPTLLSINPADLNVSLIKLPFTARHITYLPATNRYIASATGWEIYVLNENFDILTVTDAEDGCIYPRFNEAENLIGYYSRDQEAFYDLYTLTDRPTHITSFYDWDKKRSTDLKFNGDNFVVAYNHEIAYYHQTTQLWVMGELFYGPTLVEFINDKLLAMVKYDILYVVDIQQQQQLKSVRLTLPFDPEKGLRHGPDSLTITKDKQHLILITIMGIQLIKVEDIL